LIRNGNSHGARLVIAAFMSLVLLTGCNIFNPKKTDKPPEQTDRDRTTPARLLNFFAYQQADPQRDIVEYGRCLHTSYQFYFTQTDRQGDPSIPEFWTKEQDITSTTGMFQNAINITMSITVEDTLGTEACDPGNPSGPSCTTYTTRIDLQVTVPDTPENLTLIVHGLADISITRDPVDANLYVIYQITDRTNELGRPAPMLSSGELVQEAPAAGQPREVSWGELKSTLERLDP
jgi:hypothetical protein